MNRVHKLAFAIFGKYVRKRSYDELRLALKQAHLALPWDIYASTACFLAVITAIIGAISAYLLYPVWQDVYSSLAFLKAIPGSYGEVIFIILIIFLFSLFIGLATYYIILAYPKLIAYSRKGKIELTLPHAIAYMHALSKGNLSLISIFKSLSEHVNVYGEAAEEIAYIVMDTELYGRDLITALKNAAITTPSQKFRDFLENLINVAETGSNQQTFFENMVEHYQKSAEADQSLYLEVLGMLAETYVSVFVAGPLFLITILIVMGIMGPGSMLILKLVVYAVIPLSAIAFSVLLSIISLRSDTKLVKIYTTSKKLNQYDDVRTRPFDEDDYRNIRRLHRSLRWTSIIENRKNPLKPFFADPLKTFYITIPVTVLYSILSIHDHKITIDLLDDVIIINLLILLTPFLFFYEMQSRRIKRIDSSVPDFLRRLAVINDVGMPLISAIKSLTEINLGVLSTEVKLIYRDLVWSNDLANALMKFERRVRTVAISRIITLITKASETTGNIKETLRVAAADAALAEKLRREKFTILLSYLVVVYMAFAVFMLVLYVFATMFLPEIPSTNAYSGMFSISAHKGEYITLFMHASVIQGFCSGIIAGQMMGEGVYDGLKHSVLMMSAAYIFFTWFI